MFDDDFAVLVGEHDAVEVPGHVDVLAGHACADLELDPSDLDAAVGWDLQHFVTVAVVADRGRGVGVQALHGTLTRIVVRRGWDRFGGSG